MDDALAAVVRRHMAVAPHHVFAAHAKAEHIMRWFGPVGYPVTECDWDFRPGGVWRMVMTGPDGEKGPPFGGRIVEIIPDRRIVFTDGFEDGGASMGLQSRGTINFAMDFAPSGGGTDVTLTLTFASAKMKAEYLGVGMLEGIASGWDQWEPVARELAAAG
jgi:uncharacterized protein YndB with AHSA1/START domain